MSVELTSFEVLTMAESHPLKQQYRQEQAELAETFRTDHCRATTLGALCLRCSTEIHVHNTEDTDEITAVA